MRLVLDTNVVISGLLWGGQPLRLLELGATATAALYSCPQLLAELLTVLNYPKFFLRVRQSGRSASQLCNSYAAMAHLVTVPPQHIPSICRDPNDNVVLACAHIAKADLIVTGDNDLLACREFHRIPVVHVADAISRVAKTSP
jgi:putative PIN family toxin of toxin-antitoxin system